MRFSCVREAPDLAQYRAVLGCRTLTQRGPPVHFEGGRVWEAARVSLCRGDSPPRYSITSSAPLSERPARIRALESEIEQLEYLEEALVMQALDRGEAVERRSDASPAAILQARVSRSWPQRRPTIESARRVNVPVLRRRARSPGS
jgi:hypothetical protein